MGLVKKKLLTSKLGERARDGTFILDCLIDYLINWIDWLMPYHQFAEVKFKLSTDAQEY